MANKITNCKKQPNNEQQTRRCTLQSVSVKGASILRADIDFKWEQISIKKLLSFPFMIIMLA